MDGFNDSFSSVVTAINNAQEIYNSGTLTSAVKKTMVSSRVIIQNSCAQEEILPDILQCMQQLYIAWILAALNLNTYVDNSRTTVKNMLDTIATEDFNKPYIPTTNILDGLKLYSPTTSIKDILYDSDALYGSGKIVEVPKNVPLPIGRVVEVSFNTASKQTLKTNILVNLYPQFIQNDIAQMFFSLNIKPKFSERFFRWRAGEISFWKDFLFELDLRENRKNMLKKDNTGMLQELENNNTSSFTKKVWNLVSYMVGQTQLKQNIYNVIYIFNKPDFDIWCKKGGIDPRSTSKRTTFMRNIAAMMIATIDSDFQRVEFYFSGVDPIGEYNFNQIKVQSATEKYDLASIMKAYTTSSAPRF